MMPDMHREAEPQALHPLLSAGYKKWLVAVMLLVSLLNFPDRAILLVLAQPSRKISAH